MIGKLATLGSVMQLAFVPQNVDAALAFWTKTMGVGPFFRLPHVAYRKACYRGASSNIDFSVLIGYWGEMQIEIIEQHCDSPSIYRSWRENGSEGLHHTCVLVDSIAKAREVCENAKLVIEQELSFDSAEAIYVDTGGGPGTMLEILQPSPDFIGLFDIMRDQSKAWLGNDPVRTLG